ncbi:hypothetical protein D9M70_499440 [compost metagenome]
MMRMAAAHQDMQAALAQRPGQELQLVADAGKLVVEIEVRRQLVLQGQLHASGGKHPRAHREVRHRHLVQAGVGIEGRRIAVVAPHRDAVAPEVGQGAVVGRAVLAPEEEDAVGQVGRGELAEAGTLFAEPGADEQVVVTVLEPAQCTRPGHLHILGAMPRALQGRAHQFAGQAIARQAGVGERWPEICRHAQRFGVDAGTGEQQGEQGKTKVSSHAGRPRVGLASRSHQACANSSTAASAKRHPRT